MRVRVRVRMREPVRVRMREPVRERVRERLRVRDYACATGRAQCRGADCLI